MDQVEKFRKLSRKSKERMRDLSLEAPSAESYIGWRIHKSKTSCLCVNGGKTAEGWNFTTWECTLLSTGQKIEKTIYGNPMRISTLPSSHESFQKRA